MDSRTRVQNILARRPVDRLPIHDAFWEDTLAGWRTDGLGDQDPCDAFGMDFDAMYLDLSGRREQKVLARDDDFGTTRGLLFSPAMWRDILKPLYQRVATFLHQEDISFWLHSCGDVRALIPDLIESGLDVLQPLQVAAGMDVRELIPKYGNRLVFFGNISAKAMSGPAELIQSEIQSKLAIGCHHGGYIYHSDHSIPPEVTLDRYRDIMSWVQRYGRLQTSHR